VPEPSYLTAIRESYDTVAAVYAERYALDAWLAASPLDRALLVAFAELATAAGGDRPIADIGCGPGHLTAHLSRLGAPAFGIDLSPKMVELARRAYPDLRFHEGSMTALDIGDGELGGILAWYSTHHNPPEQLPVIFAEFHRALAPGGHLLLGMHVGDEHLSPRQGYGLPVSYESYLLPPDRVARLLDEAGLPVTTRVLREPAEGQKWPHAALLARNRT
jgi:SAM-dependent methyltransferase